MEQFFRTTEKLIKDQTEIASLSTIDWNQPMWKESSLLCDKVVQNVKSKIYVFFESMLAWEAFVLNQFKPGKTKISGIWRHAI